MREAVGSRPTSAAAVTVVLLVRPDGAGADVFSWDRSDFDSAFPEEETLNAGFLVTVFGLDVGLLT